MATQITIAQGAALRPRSTSKISQISVILMSWKDWLPLITCVFSLLIVPALGYIIRLGNRQDAQKSELTATNVQVDQVKKDVGAVKDDVKIITGKLDDHGKVLYEIRGMIKNRPADNP